ncbi:aspartokinase [Dokdonia pacifica]|uniref:Aspartokinase n=1 Tax=Dokdonia pacifica TaxID=1627892 RepID=A0A238WMA3_9FLAO|nr:aspartate kinase [Dokdonia pacifica]GGG22411.1 aspartokinase [Dokdonia pacifica]SNR47685.1 aspartate kinase [Dokdonia pacifica]
MQVFKFGGASVKDADSVKNIATVLKKTGFTNKLIVISAMGKTTNALENVIHAYFNDSTKVTDTIETCLDYHLDIISILFPKGHAIFETVHTLFKQLGNFLELNKSPNYDFVYDQVICYGELTSTHIVSAFLSENNIKNQWIDARELIKTDANYRDAHVDWETTKKNIQDTIQKEGLFVTQGFVASEGNNFTTTLGREGSDYTGAIFAYCLNAENLTIWKDVPGVLNGDPRVFKNTKLLKRISYNEAIEMAFYGASVIHPKTLQPLQRKEIPLYVKSFITPENPGTYIGKGIQLDPMVACFIVKKNQILISLSSIDFSFIMEENISDIFNLLHIYKMKVTMMQNSAISFSVCIENKFNTLEPLLKKLRATYKVRWNEGVTLLTARHASPNEMNLLLHGRKVLLKQENRTVTQYVLKEE